MAHANEKLYPHFFQLLGARNVAFLSGKMNAPSLAALGIALHLDDLRPPGLAEKSTGLRRLRFGPQRIDKYLLALVRGVHHVRQANREAAMPATKPHRHLVGFGKLEIAVDLAHHVGQEFICRIAPVHAAADFRHGERAKVAALVIQLAVILFKPGLKFKAQQARRHFIGRCIGDGTDPEKRVGGAPWRTGFSRLDRRQTLRLQLVDLRHQHISRFPGHYYVRSRKARSPNAS